MFEFNIQTVARNGKQELPEKIQRFKVTLNYRIYMSIAIQVFEVEALNVEDAKAKALTKSSAPEPWLDKVEQI